MTPLSAAWMSGSLRIPRSIVVLPGTIVLTKENGDCRVGSEIVLTKENGDCRVGSE
jgi:hypothetical protein